MTERTENDWRALERAERQGLEPPGTVARLLRETEGKPMISLLPNALPSGKELDGLALLASLVKLLSDPASAKRAAEYHASATEYREQAMRSELAARELAEAHARHAAEQAATLKKHQADIARMTGEFDARCKDREQSVSEREARVAAREAQYQKDADSLALQHAAWARRMSAFESAA